VRLVDSHCHLQSDRLVGEADMLIGAARLAGVERILVPGWNIRSSEGAIELADRFPWLDVAVGVHPHEAAEVDERGWARIVELSSDARVLAIGETGLDYDRRFSPIDAQLANLRRNLVLARESDRPVILHCRSASGGRDAQDALLAEVRGVPGVRPLIHSFSGPVDYAKAMLDLGAVISFSGLVFRAGEEASAEVATIVPADRLLVETDSPFLAPPTAPRRRNEPAFVGITAAWVAEQRDAATAEVGEGLIAAYDALLQRDRGSLRP
jgi:TatD DNase family protein